ncbi:hypothetical protein [Litoribacter populi]|uniref:hypothetical protein n=1 Tax=Litoribacter populi TaxID=2598460 RepID=UPI0011814FF1|nr:hypothetical protein [Litoribacter populi]
MSKLKKIIRHRDNGRALQIISKTVGIARNTVKKYLQLIEAKNLGYGNLLDMGDEVLDALLADPGHTSEQRFVDLEAFFL